jgi:hypothetical protein
MISNIGNKLLKEKTDILLFALEATAAISGIAVTIVTNFVHPVSALPSASTRSRWFDDSESHKNGQTWGARLAAGQCGSAGEPGMHSSSTVNCHFLNKTSSGC